MYVRMYEKSIFDWFFQCCMNGSMTTSFYKKTMCNAYEKMRLMFFLGILCFFQILKSYKVCNVC